MHVWGCIYMCRLLGLVHQHKRMLQAPAVLLHIYSTCMISLSRWRYMYTTYMSNKHTDSRVQLG